MEFQFNVNEYFKRPIVEIGNTLLPPDFVGDRRALWNTVNKVAEVVNEMGEASAHAQGLNKPITTAERLRQSDQNLYLLVDHGANNGNGAVTGMLKIGKKGLYVFDRDGQHYQVTPPCVLDFYVHEKRQRSGLGKKLFEYMLERENVKPHNLAIDRPSDKFLNFLNKHYYLQNPIKQMNNYVVFDGFFPENQKKDTSEGSPLNRTNGLQSSQSPNNQQPLYGRYGAPRPPCSMGQIIHNTSAQKNSEPTSSDNFKRSPGVTPTQVPVQQELVPPVQYDARCYAQQQFAPQYPQNTFQEDRNTVQKLNFQNTQNQQFDQKQQFQRNQVRMFPERENQFGNNDNTRVQASESAGNAWPQQAQQVYQMTQIVPNVQSDQQRYETPTYNHVPQQLKQVAETYQGISQPPMTPHYQSEQPAQHQYRSVQPQEPPLYHPQDIGHPRSAPNFVPSTSPPNQHPDQRTQYVHQNANNVHAANINVPQAQQFQQNLEPIPYSTTANQNATQYNVPPQSYQQTAIPQFQSPIQYAPPPQQTVTQEQYQSPTQYAHPPQQTVTQEQYQSPTQYAHPPQQTVTQEQYQSPTQYAHSPQQTVTQEKYQSPTQYAHPPQKPVTQEQYLPQKIYSPQTLTPNVTQYSPQTQPPQSEQIRKEKEIFQEIQPSIPKPRKQPYQPIPEKKADKIQSETVHSLLQVDPKYFKPDPIQLKQPSLAAYNSPPMPSSKKEESVASLLNAEQEFFENGLLRDKYKIPVRYTSHQQQSQEEMGYPKQLQDGRRDAKDYTPQILHQSNAVPNDQQMAPHEGTYQTKQQTSQSGRYEDRLHNQQQQLRTQYQQNQYRPLDQQQQHQNRLQLPQQKHHVQDQQHGLQDQQQHVQDQPYLQQLRLQGQQQQQHVQDQHYQQQNRLQVQQQQHHVQDRQYQQQQYHHVQNQQYQHQPRLQDQHQQHHIQDQQYQQQHSLQDQYNRLQDQQRQNFLQNQQQQFVPMDPRPLQKPGPPQYYGSEAGDQRRPDQQPTPRIPQTQQQQQQQQYNVRRRYGDPHPEDEQQQIPYEGGRTERNVQETGNEPIDRNDANPQDAAPWHRDTAEQRSQQPVEEERIYSQERPVAATGQKKEQSPVRMRQGSYIGNDFGTHPEGENRNLTKTKSKISGIDIGSRKKSISGQYGLNDVDIRKKAYKSAIIKRPVTMPTATAAAVADSVHSSPKLERPKSLEIQTEISVQAPPIQPEVTPVDEEDGGQDDLEPELEKLRINEDLAAPSDSSDKDSGKKTPRHLTEQGYFDLKFYHNKLW